MRNRTMICTNIMCAITNFAINCVPSMFNAQIWLLQFTANPPGEALCPRSPDAFDCYAVHKPSLKKQ